MRPCADHLVGVVIYGSHGGPPVSMDLFALATLPTAADEAGGPPSIKFYELRDNLGTEFHSAMSN